MQIAIIAEGLVVTVGDHTNLFQERIFASDGPDDDFLTQNNCARVLPSPVFDPETHRLVSIDPVVTPEGVVEHELIALTSEEIASRLAQAKQAAKARLANLRWMASLRTNWRGFTIPCDTAAQSNVTGAVVGAQLPGAPLTRMWKLSDVDFVSLDFGDLIEMGQTMTAHVQACYGREAELIAAITVAKDKAALDAIAFDGWPAIT